MSSINLLLQSTHLTAYNEMHPKPILLHHSLKTFRRWLPSKYRFGIPKDGQRLEQIHIQHRLDGGKEFARVPDQP